MEHSFQALAYVMSIFGMGVVVAVFRAIFNPETFLFEALMDAVIVAFLLWLATAPKE